MAKSSLNTVDCVIGGVQKGGTTYLHRILGEKIPELCLSQPKEAKIFLRNKFFKTTPSQTYINEKYEAFFPAETTGKIRIDASPAYFYQTKVAKRIYNYNPSMKWMICLRNPISRCYSHWKMRCNNKLENRSFLQCVENAIDSYNDSTIDFQSEHDRTKGLIRRGLYMEQILRLEDIFETDNIQYLFSSNMFLSEPLTLKTCSQFLLEGKKTHSPILGLVLPETKEKPSQRILNSLLEFYEADILALSEKLDVNLNHWLSNPMSF